MATVSKAMVFTVDGLPVPKARPSVTSQGVYYTPRTRGARRLSYDEYKTLVRLACRDEMMRTEWDDDGQGRYSLFVVLALARRTRAAGDLDNILGSIMDALQIPYSRRSPRRKEVDHNQGEVWADDNQVDTVICRVYRDPSQESAHVIVTITQLEGKDG